MESLAGMHVFTSRERAKPGTGLFRRYSSTRKYQRAVVRCQVAEQRGNQVKLVAEGNGNPDIDDKFLWTTLANLILMPGTNDVRVEEQHGRDGLGPLGVWQDST